MKTSMNRAVLPGPGAGLRLLNWSGEAIALSGRQSFVLARRAKVPELRIMGPVEDDGLFKHAITAKANSGHWETIVYFALAVSAAGAVLTAFLVG